MMGRTQLVFIEPGTKINGAYYRGIVLSQHLLLAMQNIAGEQYIFQQDETSSHTARETVALLRERTSSFGCDHPAVRISILWTIRSGAFCSTVCTENQLAQSSN